MIESKIKSNKISSQYLFRWRKRLLWLLFALTLVTAALYLTPFVFFTGGNLNLPPDTQPIYADSTKLINPIKYRADIQNTHDTAEVKKIKIAAAALYPDARSCLQDDEQKEQNPNLLMVNWELFNGADFIEISEICLFRIFSAMKNREDISNWLNLFEFEVKRFMPESTFFGGKELGATMNLRGFKYLSKVGKWPIFPTKGWWRIRQRMAWSKSITIYFSDDEIIKVSIFSPYN